MQRKIKTLRATAMAVALGAAAAAMPARADLVLLGADYFTTIQPTMFAPLGSANPLAGMAMGPGTTDTIVHRKQDCALMLGSNGSNCAIDIEMVALQLVSTVDPMVRVRESPSVQSIGTMTIASDGSGNGGSFDSFFDIFVEISFDGGGTWSPQPMFTLTQAGGIWSTIEQGLLVDGLTGSQTANRHTDKGTNCQAGTGQPCVDFYVVGSVTEQHPGVGVHTAIPTPQIPEPSSVALAALALLVLTGVGRRKA